MPSLRIILSCITAAVVYGIVHDQVTARVCVEYFTIGHPPVFNTVNSTLLGIGWGILATWWVGLMLGVFLAIASRAGTRPKRDASSLLRPIVQLLVVMALIALAAGIAGWVCSRFGVIHLIGPIAQAIPHDRHIPFLATLWAHSASYLAGFVGGCIAIVGVWRSRHSIIG